MQDFLPTPAMTGKPQTGSLSFGTLFLLRSSGAGTKESKVGMHAFHLAVAKLLQIARRQGQAVRRVANHVGFDQSLGGGQGLVPLQPRRLEQGEDEVGQSVSRNPYQ